MNILDLIVKFITKKQVYGLVLIIVIALIIYNIGKLIISKIFISGKNNFEIKKRKTVVSIFESIYKYIVLFVAIIFILELYGYDAKSLVAGLGIASVVIGLALQDVMKDIIGGISIIMENYFVVGDYVTYNDFTGQVVEFGLKSTKIKKVTGEVYVVSNRNFSEVINLSQKSSCLMIDIPTSYDEKADKVEKVLNEVIAEIKKLPNVLEDCEYLGISSFESSDILYTIKVTCVQEKQWELKRKVLGMIKKAYDKNKIKIPYTQIEVHHGQDI